MAYYCKFYAVNQGMSFLKNGDPVAAGKAKEYLIGELGDLETIKATMGEIDKEH